MVSAGELATFSCTLNVTGNETLQFQLFHTNITDTDESGCHIDTSTYARTVCSWPSSWINMTCDYSIAYQITCVLTVGGLTIENSTQVICSTVPGEPAPFATAGLAVRSKCKEVLFILFKLLKHYLLYYVEKVLAACTFKHMTVILDECYT